MDDTAREMERLLAETWASLSDSRIQMRSVPDQLTQMPTSLTEQEQMLLLGRFTAAKPVALLAGVTSAPEVIDVLLSDQRLSVQSALWENDALSPPQRRRLFDMCRSSNTMPRSIAFDAIRTAVTARWPLAGLESVFPAVLASDERLCRAAWAYSPDVAAYVSGILDELEDALASSMSDDKAVSLSAAQSVPVSQKESARYLHDVSELFRLRFGMPPDVLRRAASLASQLDPSLGWVYPQMPVSEAVAVALAGLSAARRPAETLDHVLKILGSAGCMIDNVWELPPKVLTVLEHQLSADRLDSSTARKLVSLLLVGNGHDVPGPPARFSVTIMSVFATNRFADPVAFARVWPQWSQKLANHEIEDLVRLVGRYRLDPSEVVTSVSLSSVTQKLRLWYSPGPHPEPVPYGSAVWPALFAAGFSVSLYTQSCWELVGAHFDQAATDGQLGAVLAPASMETISLLGRKVPGARAHIGRLLASAVDTDATDWEALKAVIASWSSSFGDLCEFISSMGSV